MLQQQGRVTQIADREERVAAIARDDAAKPEDTLIVSPDNASRRELNRAVREQLQNGGLVAETNHFLPTLIPRSELTGADRPWAAKFQPGDVLHYTVGSKEPGIARRSYATVTGVVSRPLRRSDGLKRKGPQLRTRGAANHSLRRGAPVLTP